VSDYLLMFRYDTDDEKTEHIILHSMKSVEEEVAFQIQDFEIDTTTISIFEITNRFSVDETGKILEDKG